MTYEKWTGYTDGDILKLNHKSPADFIDEIKMDYIRPYLPLHGVILEVGSGSGRLLTRIGLEHKEDYIVVGMDNLPESNDIIRKSITKFELNGLSVRGDAFYLPLQDNSIDVVCSGGLLEHFNEPDVNMVINEMVRVLKSGGLFYADIIPYKRSLCRPLVRSVQWEYENDFNMKKWRDIFIKNRLMNIKMFNGLVLPPDFYGRWRSSGKMNFMYKHKDFIKSLDNTVLSSILGFAVFVFGTKGR